MMRVIPGGRTVISDLRIITLRGKRVGDGMDVIIRDIGIPGTHHGHIHITVIILIPHIGILILRMGIMQHPMDTITTGINMQHGIQVIKEVEILSGTRVLCDQPMEVQVPDRVMIVEEDQFVEVRRSLPHQAPEHDKLVLDLHRFDQIEVLHRPVNLPEMSLQAVHRADNRNPLFNNRGIEHKEPQDPDIHEVLLKTAQDHQVGQVLPRQVIHRLNRDRAHRQARPLPAILAVNSVAVQADHVDNNDR
jgi:hypothetical protein